MSKYIHTNINGFLNEAKKEKLGADFIEKINDQIQNSKN